MKIRQNYISKFDIAIYWKFQYFCRRYDISISNRYFDIFDTALTGTSTDLSWSVHKPKIRHSSKKDVFSVIDRTHLSRTQRAKRGFGWGK